MLPTRRRPMPAMSTITSPGLQLEQRSRLAAEPQADLASRDAQLL
jgi:hypothetical protein